MKLKCIDGIVREFEVCEANTRVYREASCKECGMLFGMHPTSELKPLFIRHTCNMEYTRIKPCDWKHGDETFSFLVTTWNITEMQKYAEKYLKPRVLNRTTIESYYNNFAKSVIQINEDYAMKTDISKPGLMARISEKPATSIIVDGNHRLAKAYFSNKSFSCFIFSYVEQLRFITSSDGIKYIQAYNSNMKGRN